ncbi:hypothetical protein FA15DRAFT_674075 [Coprinopsis marcescibilis]|uniref:Uncharacterized protein n=1 Tax=Coprinopsis marcescibilis TaxID=230819 RepID=A0A5C3KI96_COPMA|nr:hypothetical protein FA15DRAFT_674075 [Coprinopsis marcescibilis]
MRAEFLLSSLLATAVLLVNTASAASLEGEWYKVAQMYNRGYRDLNASDPCDATQLEYACVNNAPTRCVNSRWDVANADVGCQLSDKTCLATVQLFQSAGTVGEGNGALQTACVFTDVYGRTLERLGIVGGLYGED